MASCRVCGARARTEDQRFCRVCGSALARPDDGATAAPAAVGRPWAAVLGPLAVAVICVSILTILAGAILKGGRSGADDLSFPQSSPTAYPTPEVSVSSEVPTPAASTETSELLQHIPASIAASCVEEPGFKELSEGLEAAVGCEHLGPGYVDKIIYMQYDSDSSMEAAYQYVVEVYTNGALQESPGCKDGSARGRWSQNSVEAGSFACYESSSSGVRLWWSTDGTAILTRASDEDLSVPSLWTWFLETDTGPF
jgi:hypothetical protein